MGTGLLKRMFAVPLDIVLNSRTLAQNRRQINFPYYKTGPAGGRNFAIGALEILPFWPQYLVAALFIIPFLYSAWQGSHRSEKGDDYNQVVILWNFCPMGINVEIV